MPTVLSEVEAIDLILRIIDLVDILHSNKLVHTNLCPQEIFLRDSSLDQMCFLNLYHASWDTKTLLEMEIPGVKETLTKLDLRTR